MGWPLVGHPSHPVPDDPDVISRQVDHLRAVARAIQTQAERLTDVNPDRVRWDSDAADGFRRVVNKLPHDLKALQTRYERVATAMDSYNRTVRNARAQAEDGLAKAEAAADHVEQAQQGVRQISDFASQAEQAAPGSTKLYPPACHRRGPSRGAVPTITPGWPARSSRCWQPSSR